MPRSKAADAAGAADALVGDLTSFTDEEIASGLENISVSITCKVCHVQKNTLKELLNHLSTSKCGQLSQDLEKGSTPDQRRSVRGKQAPHLPESSQSGQDSVPHSASRKKLEPPSSSVATRDNTPKRTLKRKLLPGTDDTPSGVSPRRATRISTGTIKRKTAAELLGITIKQEPVSDEESDSSPAPVVKRGRGRPRKHVDGAEKDTVKEKTPQKHLTEDDTSQLPQKRGRGRPRKIRAGLDDEETVASQKTNRVMQIKRETQDPDYDPAEDDYLLTHPQKKQPALGSPKECATAADHSSDRAGKSTLQRSPATSMNKPSVTSKVSSAVKSVTLATSPQKSPSSQVATNTEVGKKIHSPLAKPARIVFKTKLNQERKTTPAVNQSSSSEQLASPTNTTLDIDTGDAEGWQTQGKKVKVEVEEVFMPGVTVSIQGPQSGEGEETLESETLQDRLLKIVNVSDLQEGCWTEATPADSVEVQKLAELPVSMSSSLAKEPSQKTSQEVPLGYQFLTRAKWKRERTYRCGYCKSRGFGTQEQLDFHVQCHIPSKEQEAYKCPKCQQEIPFWTRMLHHALTHTEYREMLKGSDITRNLLGEFKCPICSKVFDKKANFTCHYRKTHFKKTRVCYICGDNVQGADRTFHRHVEKCQNIEKKCPHCAYTTTVSHNLKLHMNLHSDSAYVCDVCQKMCTSKVRLRMHKLTHDPNRPLTVCDQCGKNFKTSDAVKKHVMRFHTEVTEMFKCGSCEYTTKMELDLKKHVKSVHNKKFQCPTCPFQTNTDTSFQVHLSYHLPDRVFPCSYPACYYRAVTQKQLSDHMSQVHNTTSKHQCPLCFKYYKKRTHLLRHLVSHTGEKAYHCKQCGMEFVSHSTYYRHRKKTGHDAKREGVVSVPQNISIQYVEEVPGENAATYAEGDVTASEQAQISTDWQITEIPEEVAHTLQSLTECDSQQEGKSATEAIKQVMSEEQDVTEDTALATVMEDGISVHPTLRVTVEEVGSNDSKAVLVPTTYSIGDKDSEMIRALHIPDSDDRDYNVIEESPQVIYVVKGEDGSMTACAADDSCLSISLEQPLGGSGEGMSHDTLAQTTEAVTEQEQAALEELIMDQQVIMQDDGSVAFVEVSSAEPAGEQPEDPSETIKTENGDYAVVIKEVQVPEAALSMLQLQSGKS